MPNAICMVLQVRATIRFVLNWASSVAPQLQVIAPWREWNIKSREDAIDFASAHNIPVPVTKKKDYSMDWNIWHLSHEGSDLEDPANEPNPDIYIFSGTPEGAPDKDEYVELEFVEGVPVAVNGKKMEPVELLTTLNEIGPNIMRNSLTPNPYSLSSSCIARNVT